jgi:hypothetical protein
MLAGMKATLRTALFLLGGLSLAWLPAAQATTIRARTTEQLFRDSGLVAVARVQEVRSEQVGGRIITRATLEVTEALKGTANAAKVEVVVPGGQVGEWVQRVEGTPSLTKDESCVVFLTQAGASRFQFAGLEQGKLRIEASAKDPLGGVVRRSSTARLVEQPATGTLRDVVRPAETEPLKPYLEHLRRLSREAR